VLGLKKGRTDPLTVANRLHPSWLPSCIILGILRIILGILCILLGIILGISRILGINISELSKSDPNHKKP
jgi:hypothetical protein